MDAKSKDQLDIVTSQIVVSSGGLAFEVKYPNSFDSYVIFSLSNSGMSAVMPLLEEDPFEVYVNCVNCAVLNFARTFEITSAVSL